MGFAQVFVGKIFVHWLQTTKSTKILPLENYPLYGIYYLTLRTQYGRQDGHVDCPEAAQPGGETHRTGCLPSSGPRNRLHSTSAQYHTELGPESDSQQETSRHSFEGRDTG